jgi:hypothetical protein
LGGNQKTLTAKCAKESRKVREEIQTDRYPLGLFEKRLWVAQRFQRCDQAFFSMRALAPEVFSSRGLKRKPEAGSRS